MNKNDVLEKQLSDKTGTYEIRINPRVHGFNIISQVSLYMNFHKSILDMKKLFFEQLKMYHNNIIFDEMNIMNSIEIQGNMNGSSQSNLQHLPNKTKIKDFGCGRPYFSFYFPQVVQVQLENNDSVFIFKADDFVSGMCKFFKSKLSVDISKFSLNEKPLVLTERIGSFFNLYGVNVIKMHKNVATSSNSSDMSRYGSLYLIQTREFQNQNIPIFKVGKTANDITERLGKYGKGGQVLFTMAVDISKLDQVELDLINLFKEKFSQKQEVGTEYFEGNLKEMISEMHNTCFGLL
jgi:hypothetical protein